MKVYERKGKLPLHGGGPNSAPLHQALRRKEEGERKEKLLVEEEEKKGKFHDEDAKAGNSDTVFDEQERKGEPKTCPPSKKNAFDVLMRKQPIPNSTNLKLKTTPTNNNRPLRAHLESDSKRRKPLSPPEEEEEKVSSMPPSIPTEQQPQSDGEEEGHQIGKKDEGQQPTRTLIQMHLDLGQKDFNLTHCKECGFAYTKGLKDDEQAHSRIHEERVKGVRIRIKPNQEKRHSLFPSEKSYILQFSHPIKVDSVNKVRQIVDDDLGYVSEDLPPHPLEKTFVYVSDGRIVGCVVAQPISSAFRVLTDSGSNGAPPKDSNSLNFVHYMSETAVEGVLCGISRMWVHPRVRSRGVCTRLIDYMRAEFCLGDVLRVDEIAFSQPTRDGHCFCLKYTKRDDYPVFK